MLTTHDKSADLESLGNAIKAYRLASQQSMVFAMIHTARNLAYALHAETKKIAPSIASIEDIPSKVGWLSKPRAKSKGTAGSRHVHSAIRHYGGILPMIRARIDHRGYQSAGWIPAIKGFVSNDTVTSYERKIGGITAAVEKDNGRVHIIMTNRATNIMKSMEKHDILHKSVTRVFGGFSGYFQKKLGDEGRKAFWALRHG